jgi:hypothetical protein
VVPTERNNSYCHLRIRRSNTHAAEPRYFSAENFSLCHA